MQSSIYSSCWRLHQSSYDCLHPQDTTCWCSLTKEGVGIGTWTLPWDYSHSSQLCVTLSKLHMVLWSREVLDYVTYARLTEGIGKLSSGCSEALQWCRCWGVLHPAEAPHPWICKNTRWGPWFAMLDIPGIAILITMICHCCSSGDE